MKKILIAILTLSVLLVGCANSGEEQFNENTLQDVDFVYVTDVNNQQMDAIKIDTSSDGDNSEALNISLSADPKSNANILRFSDDLKAGSFDESDYVLTVSGTKITLAEDFLPNYEKLGQCKIEKSKACLESGYDIDYFYNDGKLGVYTMVKDSKQVIFNIEIRDDKCETAKGAKIGKSSKDDIYQMYGMPTDHSGKVFKYILSDKKYCLEFAFDDKGIVESIDYIDNSVS